ncbi:MAG: hypothetical protein JWO31_2094 [Phycisphaerales bacterium]|nr:hypothetical protein [Phycisphaerales bacterium]
MTLVELVVSLALMTIIMGASTSIVLVASRALSNETSNVGADALAARQATDRVVDDLTVATAVIEQTAKAVTMTVPDRTGDGVAETIRYAWTGTPGDPLTRSVNGGAAGVVAANVRALNLAYLTKTVGKPPAVTGPEQGWVAHAATAANANTSGLTSTKWSGGSYAPTLPATAVSWTVSRCRVRLAKKATLGTVTVRLRYATSAGVPTGADLATGSLLTTNLVGTTAAWADVTLSPVPALDPAKPVALVLSYAGSATVADVEYDNANADAALAYATSTDAGVSWSSNAGKTLSFYLWGTVTTQDAETLDFQSLPAGQ